MAPRLEERSRGEYSASRALAPGCVTAKAWCSLDTHPSLPSIPQVTVPQVGLVLWVWIPMESLHREALRKIESSKLKWDLDQAFHSSCTTCGHSLTAHWGSALCGPAHGMLQASRLEPRAFQPQHSYRWIPFWLLHHLGSTQGVRKGKSLRITSALRTITFTNLGLTGSVWGFEQQQPQLQSHHYQPSSQLELMIRACLTASFSPLP